MIVADVLRQHAEGASDTYVVRSVLTHSAHATLKQLARFDERLFGFLDGLAVGGDAGWALCQEGLEHASADTVFVAGYRALQDRRIDRLNAVLAISESLPEVYLGVLSALCWSEPKNLAGVVRDMLVGPSPYRRSLGIAACALHRVDPGLVGPPSLLQDPEPRVRCRSIRAAGELGIVDFLPLCSTCLADKDSEVRFWAAWSSVLLGGRKVAVHELAAFAGAQQPDAMSALMLGLQSLDVASSHVLLKSFAESVHRRLLLHGSGVVGDPKYIPWLMEHMRKDETSRLAGESFSLITGVDLEARSLDCPRPEDFEAGPTDNPDDDNVAMDPDEGLPWPDVQKIEAWWMQNRDRFTPGRRYFMGEPVTKEHCIHVLKHGYQRQRILAAQYLCLLEPGTPLFNTSAPAWRQQRLLARM